MKSICFLPRTSCLERRLAQSEALRLESGRNSNELIHAQLDQ
jgi:hypothetical protein